MDEYVAIDTEKANAVRADHTLALLQLVCDDGLRLIAAEANKIPLPIAHEQDTVLFKIPRAKLAESLLVDLALCTIRFYGRQEFNYGDVRFDLERGTVLLTSPRQLRRAE